MKKILLILLLAVSFISFSQRHKRSLLMNNNSSGAYNFEQALKFDGVDDYADLPFTFNSSTATISFWFKTNADFIRALGKDITATQWIQPATNVNQINLRKGIGGVNFNFPAINTGVWHHVYVYDNSGSCRVFLDGVESTSGTQTVNGVFDFNEVMRTGGTVNYEGILDDLLLYNAVSANPQADALAIYNSGAGSDPLITIPSSQQLYRFNNNGNNDGSLGGSLTLNNFIADPYVGSVGNNYLLDNYTNASAAYSLRYLSSDFVGANVVLVRRDIDNTELGFTPAEIVDGTLISWVGVSGSAYVSRWYDQSGNNRDATQTVLSQQPIIVNSGVLNIDNGKPYFNYLTSQLDGLQNSSSGLNSGNGSAFFTYNSNDTNGGVLIGSSGNAVFAGAIENGSTSTSSLSSGFPSWYKNSVLISPENRDILYDNYVINQDVLVSVLNINFANPAWNTIKPFTYYQSLYVQNSKIKEFVIYNSDQTSNKTGIESNINAYYTIY